jgi:hypothetical protein
MEEIDARSFHLNTWEHDGLQCFVIGDVATEGIRTLSDLFKKQ